MAILLTLLHIMAAIAFVGIRAVQPARSPLRHGELRRRADKKDAQATVQLRRQQFLADVYSLQSLLASVLLVTIVLLGIAAYGWVAGIITSVLIAVFGPVLAHRSFLKRIATGLYEKKETAMLRFIERHQRPLRILRSTATESDDQPLGSREELQELISEAESVVSEDERTRLLALLNFDNRLVRDVMTPKAAIETIGKNEVLGPVVLHDLHQKGHSRIPVIEKDIDHVIGILYTHQLLTIEGGKRYSRTAEKAMSPDVYYIHESQQLSEALAAFLRTHHHLFIVINEYRETVGLLSLEDVIEALLGQKVVDEFDVHDDLHEVAKRRSATNNRPKGHIDVPQ